MCHTDQNRLISALLLRQILNGGVCSGTFAPENYTEGVLVGFMAKPILGYRLKVKRQQRAFMGLVEQRKNNVKEMETSDLSYLGSY